MIQHFFLLLSIQFRSFFGAVANEWENNRLKLIAGAVTLLVMAGAFFFMFRGLFRYLASLDADLFGFGTALASRLFGMALLAFGVFVGVSSLITGNSALYRSERSTLLMAMPVRRSSLAASSVLQSWFNAGWTMLLMGYPILIAFAEGLEFTTVYLSRGLLLYPLLLLVWLSAGTLLTVLLGWAGGPSGWKLFGGIALIAGCGAVVFFAGGTSSDLIIQEAPGMQLGGLQNFVSDLPGQSRGYWPHSLFLQAMVKGNGNAALILTVEAVVLAAAALTAASWKFLEAWNRSAVAEVRYRSPMFFKDGGRYSTVFQKDLLMFMRDPVQWSQLGLLTGMFAIYVINLGRFPMDFTNPYWLAVGVFINISFSAFAVATMMVRFAFPAPSMEAPGLHVLIQLPRGRELFYGSKWSQTLFLSVIPASILAWFSTMSIGAGPLLQVESVGCIFITAFTLSTINISTGCLFMRKEAGSAVSISSGQGGIISAFASVGFVLFMVGVLSWVTKKYMTDNFTELMLAKPVRDSILYLMLPVGFTVSIASFRAGIKNLRERVF
ncbi:hypothetical protein CSA37_13070 [Candidatus Fermentibacteria bacterium]|nr:MAG: hypothetical protein CSA37_13070 [Candidatus Fermentibacteria bacterium]